MSIDPKKMKSYFAANPVKPQLYRPPAKRKPRDPAKPSDGKTLNAPTRSASPAGPVGVAMHGVQGTWPSTR